MYVCVFVIGEKMLKAREAIMYGRGEDHSTDALQRKFEEFCPAQSVPYEHNPFYMCVERAGVCLGVLRAQPVVHEWAHVPVFI